MNQDFIYNYRKRIVIGILAFIGICTLVALFQYLQTGNITINTNSASSTITIQDSAGNTKKTGDETISLRTTYGWYTVTVTDKTATIKKRVYVEARKTQRLTIKPKTYANPEPILGSLGRFIISDANQFNYYNSSLNQIVMAQKNGVIDQIPTQTLESLQWVSTNYGVAKGTDGTLYSIQNRAILPLTLPAGYASTDFLSFSVNRSGGIYLVSDKDIWFGSETVGYKKIYSSGEQSLHVIPGPDKFLLITTKTTGTDEPVIEATLRIISNDGNVQHTIRSNTNDETGLSIGGAWSPNGHRLLIYNTESASTVYTDTLQKITDLPQQNISNPTWISDGQITYSLDNQTWVYDIQQKQSTVGAQLLTNTSVVETYADLINKDIYISTGTTELGNVYRFNFDKKRDQVPSDKFGIILPTESVACYADYLNVYRPTITLYLYTGDTQRCNNEITSLLKDNEIDSNAVQIYTSDLLQSGDN
jgi:hypothetical protein